MTARICFKVDRAGSGVFAKYSSTVFAALPFLISCHPERSKCFAKRSTYAVEGSLAAIERRRFRREFSRKSLLPRLPLPRGHPLRFALLFRLRPRQKPRPPQLPHRILARRSHLHRHLRHRIHDPVKILLPHGSNLRVRRRIQKVNRIRHSTLHSKFHGIQVVPQSPAQRQRVLHHPLLQLRSRGRRVSLHVPLVVRRPRIVLHDVHFFLPHHVAPVVLLKLHAMLQRHAQPPRLVVVMKKFLRRMHVIHMLPPAARIRFQESREADVVKQFLPVQRKHQIPHRLVRRPLGMLVVRQNHGRRNGHTHLVRHRVIKKLVVRRPPKRIVDDDRAVQRRILQISPIELNILRNSVDDHRILLRLIHPNPANLHKLRLHAVHLHRVNLLDQRRRKRVLHPKQNPNLLHAHSPSSIKNTSPPSSPTAASHASNYRSKHPASAGSPSHSRSPRT